MQGSRLPLPRTTEFADRKSVHAKRQRTHLVVEFGTCCKEHRIGLQGFGQVRCVCDTTTDTKSGTQSGKTKDLSGGLLEPEELFQRGTGKPQNLKVQEWVPSIKCPWFQEKSTPPRETQNTLGQGIHNTDVDDENICLCWCNWSESSSNPLATPNINHRVGNHSVRWRMPFGALTRTRARVDRTGLHRLKQSQNILHRALHDMIPITIDGIAIQGELEAGRFRVHDIRDRGSLLLHNRLRTQLNQH